RVARRRDATERTGALRVCGELARRSRSAGRAHALARRARTHLPGGRRMIDTHCHLLPGLDDGPASDSDAVALAQDLVQSGVTAIVCTPHFNRRYPTAHDDAWDRLAHLRTLLAGCDVEVELGLGAEVGPATALDGDDEELTRRAISGRFLLVELEPGTPVGVLPILCDRVEGLGLTAVLAHPERCRAVQRDLQSLSQARERGALAQVVASSLGGSWGSTIARTAWTLGVSGRADLVGSDAHRPGLRERLGRVLRELEERIGATEANRLLVETPRTIVEGD